MEREGITRKPLDLVRCQQTCSFSLEQAVGDGEIVVAVIDRPQRFSQILDKGRKKEMQGKHHRQKNQQRFAYSLPEHEAAGNFKAAPSAQMLS